MTESARGRTSKRFRRIMLLVPYILKHPGVELSQLAAAFEASEADIQSDLELLWMCGLPGYGPGDLIDVTLEADRVEIRMADYFGTPLRLTPTEALALYSGGQTLLSLPGMEGADSLRSALAKVGDALGLEDDARGVQITMEAGPARHLDVIERALVEKRRLHLQYLSASRGELTERDVDPWGIVAAMGRAYLIALDGASGEERMFRTDRIKEARILEEAAEVPDDFDPSRYRGAFTGRGEEKVSLEVSPEVARWFEDYYPVESSSSLPDGWRAVELISGGVAWAAALVLRLGRGARNVSPESVMDEARALANKLTARHA